MTAAIAERLELAAPEDWPYGEAEKYWKEHTKYSLGCNSRVCADKARKELGWKPTHDSVIDYIKMEMEYSPTRLRAHL